METTKKIKIAFVKFAGLSAGGTEKFLQTVAANLDTEKFDVTYFYCDAAPYIGSDFKHPTTSEERLQYMNTKGVRLVKFVVGAKDVRSRTHPWVDTNFWEVFKEEDYDIIQTGRAGHPEYPFTNIKKTPIVDSLHLQAGVDNQFNISRVMHICQWNADNWIAAGGDRNRVVLVSHPMEIDDSGTISLRNELQLENKFVFGFHQRNSDEIFSPIPLEAYKRIEHEGTHFILLGGGEQYRKQAVGLGIKNITFLDHTADPKRIYSFLKTLDVYAHGRKDGEVNSTAMAEALYFGLPIISHYSHINNGHVECIGKAGKVVHTVEEYAEELSKLQSDLAYKATLSQYAVERFKEKYELHGQIKNIESIYMDVYKNPFPHPVSRWISSFRLRYFVVAAYRKILKKYKNIFN